MTAKQRFNNKYALQIRERDHNPPHIHLVGGSVNATVDLNTLVCMGLIPARVKSEVLAWIQLNHDALMEEWYKWH